MRSSPEKKYLSLSEIEAHFAPEPDPQDFIASTLFMKRATEVDPDPSHDWQKTRPVFFYENEQGLIMLGEYRDHLNQTLIVGSHDQHQHRYYSTSLNVPVELSASSLFMDLIVKAIGHLPSESRFSFVQQLNEKFGELNFSGSLYPAEEEFTLKILLEYLGFFPITSDIFEVNQFTKQHLIQKRTSVQESAIPWQVQAEVVEYFKQLLLRVPTHQFTQARSLLLDIFQQHSWVHGKEVKRATLLTSLLEIMPIIRNYEVTTHQLPTPKHFNLIDQITQPLPAVSLSELDSIIEERLSRVPFAPPPAEAKHQQIKSMYAKFVAVDHIIGTKSERTWRELAHADRVGEHYLTQIAIQMQQGAFELHRQYGAEPITVAKIRDRHFVWGVGSRRVSALKALGVKEVPVLVVELE